MEKLFRKIAVLFMICMVSLTVFPENKLSDNTESSSQSNNGVFTYTYPRICLKSPDFKVKAYGQEVFVYQTSAEPFAAFSCSGPIEIEVEMPVSFSKNVNISQKILGVATKVEGNKVSFKIDGPAKLAFEIDGMPKLFIYANPVENPVQQPSDPNVKYFKAGQVHEVGELRLKDNETL